MKIKFTKASTNDGTKVTVSLLQVGEATGFPEIVGLAAGQGFVLTLNGIRTYFEINREGRTAATKSFPRSLRLPTVGRPVTAEVADYITFVD